IVITGLAVSISGAFMLVRVRTPLFVRNPYLLRDFTWGVTYVTHGLAGTGLVGLVIAHVYFAVRPDKWWITKSMILGWITRRQHQPPHSRSSAARRRSADRHRRLHDGVRQAPRRSERRALSRLPGRPRPRRARCAGRAAARARAAGDWIADDRQPQRVEPSPGAAHGSLFD